MEERGEDVEEGREGEGRETEGKEGACPTNETFVPAPCI